MEQTEIKSSRSGENVIPGTRVTLSSDTAPIPGRPLADTIRQEHYLESRFDLPREIQAALGRAVRETSPNERFLIPHDFARAIVAPAYLGQLDVNPLGVIPGSRNEDRWWQFHGERVASDPEAPMRVRITGRSYVAGGQAPGPRNTGDGRMWEHAVALDWQGYVELDGERVVGIDLIAAGRERLRWGNARFQQITESDAAHLMAGHPIDLDCGVRYAMRATAGP